MKFADSSFWVALQYARDEHHHEARALWEQQSRAVVTSNHVAGETWTFLRRRTGHREALRFIRGVGASEGVTMYHVDESLERDAWRWLERHDEREYSFVDATSFAAMRKLRIGEALAFDGDFSAAGFVELRP